MLRNHGRLLTSLSTPYVRYASTAVKASKAAEATSTTDVATEALTLEPSKVKTSRKFEEQDAVKKTFGLLQIQAALEASAFNGKKAEKLLNGGVSTATTRKKQKKKPESEMISESEVKATSTVSGTTKPKRAKKASSIPPRLLPPPEQPHEDLSSFLAYAERTGLDASSTVYKGTHYEYTVAEALKTFDFTLQRTGRSNDLGIDLVGKWDLPHQRRKKKGSEVPVLVQCKAAKPTPAMLRELEGAYVGAPAGWQGESVVALLASIQPSTKGVRAAVQRSKWPVGVLQITREGQVKQFIWNAVAAEAALEGLGVAVKYAPAEAEDGRPYRAALCQSIGLTWMGRLWRPMQAELAKLEGETEPEPGHETEEVSALEAAA